MSGISVYEMEWLLQFRLDYLWSGICVVLVNEFGCVCWIKYGCIMKLNLHSKHGN